MRLLTTLCLWALLAPGTYAQNAKSDIAATLTDYFRQVEEQKIPELLDHVHPKLLSMMGRQMFEKQYEAFFNAPNLDMTMEAFSQDKISEVFEHETGHYALVNYSFKMTLVMKPTEDEAAGNQVYEMYKKQFGDENVSEEKPGTYIVNGHRELFACQETDFEGWKLLDYEPGMKMMLAQFIAADVFEHFNK